MGKPLSDFQDSRWRSKTVGSNKLDKVLAAMPPKDRKIALEWLNDPTWTDNAISAAIRDWADENGNPHMRVTHGLVNRWRKDNK